ncbi:MAG: hypothetical protein QM731_21480 [Chitinophagaceae bacterium]
MRIPAFIAGSFLLAAISSCTSKASDYVPDSVQGYVPVYAQPEALTNAQLVSGAKATAKAGKIYAYGKYIFQNDVNLGIHIIDNTDAANPHKVSFLNIPFNSDFAIRNGYLYANAVNDLAVIDIRDITKPVLVKTVKDAFPVIDQLYPPNNGYFVCPDPSKGIVVDWKLETLTSPHCRR